MFTHGAGIFGLIALMAVLFCDNQTTLVLDLYKVNPDIQELLWSQAVFLKMERQFGITKCRE